MISAKWTDMMKRGIYLTEPIKTNGKCYNKSQYRRSSDTFDIQLFNRFGSDIFLGSHAWYSDGTKTTLLHCYHPNESDWTINRRMPNGISGELGRRNEPLSFLGLLRVGHCIHLFYWMRRKYQTMEWYSYQNRITTILVPKNCFLYCYDITHTAHTFIRYDLLWLGVIDNSTHWWNGTKRNESHTYSYRNDDDDFPNGLLLDMCIDLSCSPFPCIVYGRRRTHQKRHISNKSQ